MKQHIVNKISHPYLQRFIQNPIIDEDKLLLIISMLDQHGLTKLEMEDFVVTTMLIQIALDTHECVTNSSINSEKETLLKSRQLTVLGGIYYSSLYYKILAKSSNLSLIRVLSEGIKEINEHKIQFYHKDSHEIEDLMNSIMIIESALVTKLSYYLHEGVWNKVSSHFLFIKRLLEEKKNFIQDGYSPLFDGLIKIMFSKENQKLDNLSLEQKNDLLRICEQYINGSIQVMEGNLQKIPFINENLKYRLSHLLHNQNSNAKTFVEEG